MATTNYGLATFSSESVDTFGNLVDSVLGSSGSNMTKIDTALYDNFLNGIRASVASEYTDNVYTCTLPVLTNGGFIGFVPSANNIGAVSLLDSTSAPVLKTLKKYDDTNSIVNLSGGELVSGKIYLAYYNLLEDSFILYDFYKHPLSHSADMITDGTTNKAYTATEKTKLSGIADGAEVNVNADWNASSGDAQILNKPTSISGYGITDAYTKTEINNMVSAVYKYQGSVENYASLPSSDQVTGDVYNCTDSGINYAWTGSQWDDIGGIEALATALNNGLMTKEDFSKLAGIESGANNYIHPSNHSADIITDGTTNKAYTATEKTKLSGIASGANNYVHPAMHSADIIEDGITNKAYTATEKTKLSGIAESANNYTHPSVNHIPASGAAGQILEYESAGKAKWVTPTSHGLVYYGECSTSAPTAAKVATISGFGASQLVAGVIVGLSFLSSNTSATATLNISSTGAKEILANGSSPISGQINSGLLALFQYDGIHWVHLNPISVERLALAGGTMTGNVVGHADTDYTTARFRNISAGTADPSGGSNGDVYIKYTA